MRSLLHKFDDAIMKVVQSWPKTLNSAMHFITNLGGPFLTTGIGFLIITTGIVKSNEKLIWVGSIVLVTLLAGAFLKIVLRRKRPLTEYVFRMRFPTFSFPSGHSVGGMIVYGTLAVLAGALLTSPFSYVIIGFLALLIFAIGVSRIYLGAHYPSDVIAGWLFGAVGLIGVSLIMSMN